MRSGGRSGESRRGAFDDEGVLEVVWDEILWFIHGCMEGATCTDLGEPHHGLLQV